MDGLALERPASGACGERRGVRFARSRCGALAGSERSCFPPCHASAPRMTAEGAAPAFWPPAFRRVHCPLPGPAVVRAAFWISCANEASCAVMPWPTLASWVAVRSSHVVRTPALFGYRWAGHGDQISVCRLVLYYAATSGERHPLWAIDRVVVSACAMGPMTTVSAGLSAMACRPRRFRLLLCLNSVSSKGICRTQRPFLGKA